LLPWWGGGAAYITVLSQTRAAFCTLSYQFNTALALIDTKVLLNWSGLRLISHVGQVDVGSGKKGWFQKSLSHNKLLMKIEINGVFTATSGGLLDLILFAPFEA
jgi:hypothetical protein